MTPSTSVAPAPAPIVAPVRIAVLDDHPAVRAGLDVLLTAAPGLIHVGGAADEYALWPMLHRTRPDVLLLDLHHPGRNGLTLAAMVVRLGGGPHVVLHTALPSDAVTVAAALAGAVATIDKAAPTRELAALLRAAPARLGPAPVSARARRRVLSDLEPDDRALAAMRLAGTSVADIADVLGTTTPAVHRRLSRLLSRLAALDLVDPRDGGPSPDTETRTMPPRLAPRRRRPEVTARRRAGVLAGAGS